MSDTHPSGLAPSVLDKDIKITIPPEKVAEGVDAVLQHLIRDTYLLTTIYDQPEVELEYLLTHIRNTLRIDKVLQLRLGRSFYWLREQKTWDKVTGGAAYTSFSEWLENTLSGIDIAQVNLWIQFYLTFVECIQVGVSPEELFIPATLDIQKLGIISSQMRELKQKINMQRKELGETSPAYLQTKSQIQVDAAQEIGRVAQLSKKERSQPPDPGIHANILAPVQFFVQGHIQRGVTNKIIFTHSELILTDEALLAWEQGKVSLRFAIQGIEDVLSLQQLHTYAKEHYLLTGSFVEALSSDSLQGF